MILSNQVLTRVGNTPVIPIEACWNSHIRIFAKLEFYNPTGSVKDRAASYIIDKLLGTGEINKDTTMIESTSGNFGIALAAYCGRSGLRFIAVVDPHITPVNEMLIRSYGAEIVKVTEPDKNGGYLLTRISQVKKLRAEISNSYWVNQYGNPYNAEAYYYSLGEELCSRFDKLDYLFMGVSSGGTITGVSKRVKEKFPRARIIAVDIVGSVIFGNPPKKRYIPGIGSSLVPDILKQAKIDDVVMVDEIETIEMCRELLNKCYVFAGGSSGSVIAAIKKYFDKNKVSEDIDVAAVFPDRGERYTDTIYNDEWCQEFYRKQAAETGAAGK